MPIENEFDAVFQKLKSILKPYQKKLMLVTDTDKLYYLDTNYIMKNKRRLCFAAVRMGKAYVSFHLLPVYANPKMLNDMSPELRRRMQGKGCFNFKTVDAKLFKELAELTKAGFKAFSDPEYLKKITMR